MSWSALLWGIRRRCFSPATKDWQVFVYQANREGSRKAGHLGRRSSFSQSKGVWNSILIWGTVQGSPCWKQGSPCLEHGWGRKRGANTEVRDIGKGADQGQPGGPGCRDPELISLAMESLWKDLVRGVTIKFSF